MREEEMRERARRMIVRALIDHDPEEIDWSTFLAVVAEETGMRIDDLEEERDKILDFFSVSP